MNYSNGFDMDVVLPALQQRLGWLQPTYSGAPVLTAPNTTSTSGRYFGEDFHALCTIQNIKSSQENPSINDTQFNDYLAKRQNGMILRALNETFRKPELIEQCLLYTRFGFNDTILPNQSMWCGWCIEVGNDQSISTQITLGTFYFDANVTFNLYLFQDGVRTPLKTIPINAVAWQNTEVDFTNLVLNFKTGERYYLMYNQDDLGPAHAIREQMDAVATTRCFQAYQIQFQKATDGSLYNRDKRSYPALPQGFNLEVISFKDHTQKILRQANLFDEVQGLQMAAFALELVNNSTRTNVTQRNAEQQSQQLYADVNQAFATKEVPITPGLKSRIQAEFKRIRDTFYPPAQPLSVSMLDDCDDDLDAYEQNWMKQNAAVAINPGIYISQG